MMENVDKKDDGPSFIPPYKGGWFRGNYISKESIEDMFNWISISEEVKKEILGESIDDKIGV